MSRQKFSRGAMMFWLCLIGGVIGYLGLCVLFAKMIEYHDR